MATLASLQLPSKQLFGFVNGVSKRTFGGDATMTPEFLHENIFAETKWSVEDVAVLADEVAKVLTQAAQQSWGPNELSAHLQSIGVTADDSINTWTKVWKTEHVAAHNAMVAGSIWNATFSGMNWRVDLLSGGSSSNNNATPESSGSSSDVQQTVALVQLHSKTTGGENKSVLVEMNKAQVAEILAQMAKIQSKIEQRS